MNGCFTFLNFFVKVLFACVIPGGVLKYCLHFAYSNGSPEKLRKSPQRVNDHL